MNADEDPQRSIGDIIIVTTTARSGGDCYCDLIDFTMRVIAPFHIDCARDSFSRLPKTKHRYSLARMFHNRVMENVAEYLIANGLCEKIEHSEID